MGSSQRPNSTRAPLRLVTCEGARAFAEGVADRLKVELTPSQETWFPNGEGKFEISESLRGMDSFVFQAAIAPGEADRTPYDRFVMLLHAIDSATLADAERVTAVVPYFPGARQDKRKGRTREGISSSLFARILELAGVSMVIAVEIHNEAIAGAFLPRSCRFENIYLTRPLADFLRQEGLCGDVVASPDVGGMERARRYAARLGSRLVALSKERDYQKPSRVVASTLIGDVRGLDVLLVDDIVDTAGSAVAAIEELRSHGARSITLACAHAVCSTPAWENLQGVADRAVAEGWRFTFVGTSSISHPSPAPFYREFAIEPLVARVIANINGRGSVKGAMEEDE